MSEPDDADKSLTTHVAEPEAQEAPAVPVETPPATPKKAAKAPQAPSDYRSREAKTARVEAKPMPLTRQEWRREIKMGAVVLIFVALAVIGAVTVIRWGWSYFTG